MSDDIMSNIARKWQCNKLDKTMSLKLDGKTLSPHRGVVYQTKGKGLIYMSVQSVQSDGALRCVQYDLLQ